MPDIKVHKPPPPAAPVLNGVLGSAVDVRTIKTKHYKVCIYGRNRIGKSSLAVQFPKPMLLVACEPTESGGVDSVTAEEGVRTIQVGYKYLQAKDPSNGERLVDAAGNPVMEKLKGTQKALTLVDELMQQHRLCGKLPFATVVLDTVTAMQDIVLSELMDLPDVPTMLTWGFAGDDDYRQRSEKTREVLRRFMDLPCHVVMVAQEKDHNPPKDRSISKLTRPMQEGSFMAADLGGATVKWLSDCCGYIVQLYQDAELQRFETTSKIGNETKPVVNWVPTGRIVRRIRTMYHANYSAGFRSPSPSAVPEYIEAKTPQEMYAEMMKVMSGQRSDKGKYPDDMIK